MTQEDKELLLVDLCARLSYEVKVWYKYYSENVTEKFATSIRLVDGKIALSSKFNREGDWYPIEEANELLIKPYLRPMSSMTEEEKKELQKVTDDTFYAYSYFIGNSKPYTDGEWHNSDDNFVTNITCNKLISWLDKNHFDHRTDDEGKTLIEKSLALVAPDDMYKEGQQ